MINRVILLTIEGLGVGALPDAPEYGDAGTHTLSHLADAVDGLALPTLESLGLGHVSEIRGLRTMAQPIGSFGKLGFQSRGVDSLTGHWELAGCAVTEEFPDYSQGYPDKLSAELEAILGRPTLGKGVVAGQEALSRHGKEHLSGKMPIVWTDGRRTCHLAAHDTIIPPKELFRLCREMRKRMRDSWGLWRIVAHPLAGDPAIWRLDSARRDFAIEPPHQTMLDVLSRASQILIAVGKAGDLFSGRGITRTVQTGSWTGAMDEVGKMFSKVPRGLVYVSLDVLEVGAPEAAVALQDFDRRLSGLLEQLRTGDILIVTGDHGRDPRKAHGLPTREYVPIVVTGPRLAQGVNLGTRRSAADLGQTIVEALRGQALPVGDSFLDALHAG
ncbi:MAG TPA: phosphopentomutase [Nitrospira sp.]|nr:phosphopentomutase [Nitrospira sp.]